MSASSAATSTVSKRSRKKAEERQKPHAALDFGRLTEELESPIEELSKSKAALSTIMECFEKFKSEISVFERDFGTMQDKDNRIRELEITLRNIGQEKNKELEELQQTIVRMEEEQTAFREAKADFEKIQEAREIEHQQKLSDLEAKRKQQKEGLRKELLEKKNRLEADNAETFRKLTTDNESLEQEVKKLKKSLAQADDEKKKATQEHDIVHSALIDQHRKLNSKLDTMRREFAIESQTDEF